MTEGRLDVPGRNSARTPPSNLPEANALCWALFIVFLAVPGSLVIRGQIVSAERSGVVPENDFIYFYSMGRVFNEYPVTQLYDYDVQKKVATEVHPMQTRAYGPNSYHPLIGVLFRPFARMPYLRAYLIWMAISFSLYCGGLALFLRRFYPAEPLQGSLILCLSLCFYPLFWILTSGQISTIGFFAIALAFCKDDQKRPFMSGLALSVCLYKPPLLTLLLPMILITRRLRTLAGVFCGGAAAAVVVTGIQGVGVWPGYLERLLSFATGSLQTKSFKILWYYLDLASFSALVPGGNSWLGRIAFLACAGAAGFVLFRGWRNSVGAGKPEQRLVWATTLTWTLVLNVYVPIYDSILIVLSLVATSVVLKDFPMVALSRRFTLLWLLILACSWITVPAAQASGVQIMTILLAILGTLQLAALKPAI